MSLLLTLWGTAALAQRDLSAPPPTCNVSASFIDQSKPTSFVGLGWDVNLTCGTTDTRVWDVQAEIYFDIERVGGGFQQEYWTVTYNPSQGSVTSYVGRFMPSVACLPPGDYTWIMRYECGYFAPTDFTDYYGNPMYWGFGFGAPTIGMPPPASGTFSIVAADSTVALAATILRPPTPQGNVKISYAFGKDCIPHIYIDSIYDESIHVTQFTDEKVITLPPGQHFVYAASCYYNHIIAVQSFIIPLPQSDYTAIGQILDGSAAESKSGVTPGTMPTYVQVPLGLELRLGIQKNGAYLPAKFDLSPATLAGLANPTLYPTNAVLEYGRAVHEGQKTFRGVHIGTQTLTVTPDDPSIQPFVFTLGVFDPGALGNADVQYDSQFVDWGNKRGIPPHILKGLVRQEGPFQPFEYRYEPLSPTTGDRFIQMNLITAPYASYLLATASGLSRGALLLDLNAGQSAYTVTDDVSPRKQFFLARPSGTDTVITPQDVCPSACVSARQIFEGNDSKHYKQNWSNSRYVGATNWWDATHLAMLEFTAQTSTAASYGMMQTMYVRAIDLDWKTTDGRQNPSLLFDTAANTAIGGGSLSIGTQEFYSAYRACNPPDLATDPDFANGVAYQSQIVDALNYYNHGHSARNPNYGDNAWAFSQQYLPSHPLSKIFP